MALVVKDRVKEITTTTGTSNLTLGGAVFGFQSFSVVGNGNQTYYAIYDSATGDWEVGVGTYSTTGPTLSRDTVLESSNSGSKVVLSAGSKDVFLTYPAERSVYLDTAGSAVTVLDIGTLGTSTANITTANITAGTISTTPTNSNDLVNKTYVDGIAAQGITYHTPVKYEVPNSTGNLNATYSNGTAGVGATLTNAGTKAAFAPDGPTAQVGDRVLVYNQTNAFENGVYEVTTVGTPDPGGTNWVLTRAADADSYGLKDPNALGSGDAFFVTSGNTGAGETYVCNTAGTITFGTTAITFAQISSAQIYSAGAGLTLSNLVFSITPVGTAGTYGSASSVPVFTTNAYGQITSTTNTAISIGAGAVSGLAPSATTDTTNAANITSGTLPVARLSGSYTGITGVGTLAAGTWNASTIGATFGGTGLTTYAQGDLLYATSSTTLGRLADVVTGNALISGGVGADPSWGKIGLQTHVDGTLQLVNGGTGATTASGARSNLGLVIGTDIPSVTGTGASGTWGINITGNAATATTSTTSTTATQVSNSVTFNNSGAGAASGNGFNGSGALTVSYNTIGAPSTTGANASGTWGINITGGASSAGYSTYLITQDIRTLSPSSTAAYRLGFGFTSWANNNTAPWADYLALRSYTDATGGNDNLLLFNKSTIAMRLYQQSFGSASAYASYADVLMSNNFNSYAPTLTGGGASGTWGISISGNAATATALSSGQSNWVGTGVIGNVVGLLAWKNYNNNHVIFDASNSTTPSGTSCNNTNAAVAWAGTYPTLMGWNGSTTYGVRVDSARVADSAGSAGSVDYNNLTNKTGGTGTYTTSGDYRAPIFYDSDNTGYYIDPASTTYLNVLTTAGAITSGGNNGFRNDVYYGATRNPIWSFGNATSYGLSYFQGASGLGGVDTIGLHPNGTATGSGSVLMVTSSYTQSLGSLRAPIFYDSDNTGYYVDPAGVSNINNLLTQVAVSNNVSGLRNINPGGGTYVTMASVVNGAIRITLPQTVYPMIRFTVRVYTYDNLSFDIYCGGHTSSGYWYNTFAYMGTQSRPALNVRFTYGGGQMFVYIGELGSSWSYPQVFITDVQVGYTNYEYDRWDDGWSITFDASSYQNVGATHTVYPPTSSGNNTNPAYASILYDANNTGYYVDPASTSNVNRLNLVGFDSSGRNYSREWIEFPNFSGLYSPNNGAHFYPNNQSSYGSWATSGSRNGWAGIYDTYSGVNGIMYASNGDGGAYREPSGRWYFYYSVGNDCMGIGTSSTSSTYSLYLTKGVYAQSRIDATIFYDTNNTGYYCDPNSNSRLNGVLADGGSFYGGTYFYSDLGGYSGSLSGPALQVFATGGNSAFFSWHRSGNYAVNMGLDADNVLRIGGWSASANRFQMDMSGNLTMAGNVTAYSDEKLKKDWADLSDDFIERLASVKAGTYTRIDSGERQAGSSAQDWQELLPEVVSEDAAGTLALAYGNAAVVACVELAKSVVALRAEIKALRAH